MLSVLSLSLSLSRQHSQFNTHNRIQYARIARRDLRHARAERDDAKAKRTDFYKMNDHHTVERELESSVLFQSLAACNHLLSLIGYLGAGTLPQSI